MFDGLLQPVCSEIVKAKQTAPAIPQRAKSEQASDVVLPIIEILCEREYVNTTRSPLEVQGGIDGETTGGQ
jgi:hypothetical protein